MDLTLTWDVRSWLANTVAPYPLDKRDWLLTPNTDISQSLEDILTEILQKGGFGKIDDDAEVRVKVAPAEDGFFLACGDANCASFHGVAEGPEARTGLSISLRYDPFYSILKVESYMQWVWARLSRHTARTGRIVALQGNWDLNADGVWAWSPQDQVRTESLGDFATPLPADLPTSVPTDPRGASHLGPFWDHVPPTSSQDSIWAAFINRFTEAQRATFFPFFPSDSPTKRGGIKNPIKNPDP